MLQEYHQNRVDGFKWIDQTLHIPSENNQFSSVTMKHANNNGLLGGFFQWENIEFWLPFDYFVTLSDFTREIFYPPVSDNNDEIEYTSCSDESTAYTNESVSSTALDIIKTTPKRSVITIESDLLREYPISYYIHGNTRMLSLMPYKTRWMCKFRYFDKKYKHLKILTSNNPLFKTLVNEYPKRQWVWAYDGDWKYDVTNPVHMKMKSLMQKIMCLIAVLNLATAKSLPHTFGWLSQYIDSGILNGKELEEIIDFLLYLCYDDNGGHRDYFCFYTCIMGMVPCYYSVTFWSVGKYLCPHYWKSQCTAAPQEHLLMKPVSILGIADHAAVNGEYHGIHTDPWWKCNCVKSCDMKCKSGKLSTKLKQPASQVQLRPCLKRNKINIEYF